MRHPWDSSVRDDVLGGLVSAAVAIPLAMGFGMFALVPTNILPMARSPVSTPRSSSRS
jgi:MFS superfamily sulfate permease-like transporter